MGRLGLAALVLVMACSPGPREGDDLVPSPDGGGDLADPGPTLRLNHIQVKGTHNSYHIPTGMTVPEWAYTHAPLNTQLNDYGVRQVELDIHYAPEQGFLVHHIPYVDPGTTCETLALCLDILKAWSDDHPGHHVLFILIEPKDDVDPHPIGGHYDELDQAILSVWPRERLVVPDDVRGGHATLREALEAEGWPTVEETRDRALFLLLDKDIHRQGYLEGHPTLEGRVLFVRDGEGEAFGAILEYGNALSNSESIGRAVEGGYLVRTAADDVPGTDEENQARSQAAAASGAHLISTDFPSPVEDRAYWFDLTGGTPSRCNPLSAPEGCLAGDIEDLE